MKTKLIFLALLFCTLAKGQTPSLFLKMETTATPYGQNLSVGTLLFDRESLKRYIVLSPLASTKSISNSNRLLLDGVHIEVPAGSSTPATTAEIKEVGTNSSEHYIGELIASDGGGGPADGIVVSVWTENGVEKCLVADMVETPASPSAWSASLPPAGWHVPSRFELETCFNSVLIVNSILGSKGFKYVNYWSSTDGSDNTVALYINFYIGLPSEELKTNATCFFKYVRIH